MSYKLLLVGAGQLGRRYLEGLLRSDLSLSIDIVDNSNDSLHLCREILLGHTNKLGPTRLLDSLPAGNTYDICILSTTSESRVKLIRYIVKDNTINAWILEKFLAQSQACLDLLSTLILPDSPCWVNTPRPSMNWYTRIKAHLSQYSPLTHASVIGSNWGMACNAIHFIDLMEWLTDSKIHKIDDQKSKLVWEKAKRKGYEEAFGSISMKFTAGLNLSMSCDTQNLPRVVILRNPEHEWVIDEPNSVFRGTDQSNIHGYLELQSQMTPDIIHDILINRKCKLTPLSTSIRQHRKILQHFLKSWNQFNGLNSSYLPIT